MMKRIEFICFFFPYGNIDSLPQISTSAREKEHQAGFTRQFFRGRGNVKPKGSDPLKVADPRAEGQDGE